MNSIKARNPATRMKQKSFSKLKKERIDNLNGSGSIREIGFIVKKPSPEIYPV